MDVSDERNALIAVAASIFRTDGIVGVVQTAPIVSIAVDASTDGA